MPRNTRQHPEHDCTACPIEPSRREFVRALGVAVAGALATIGLSRRAAAEVSVHAIASLARTPSTHTYAIPSVDGVHIDKDGEVILVRWHGVVYAFNLSCPHQNTALHWNEKDNAFKCPKHHSRYEPDGTFIDGRATRGMDRFSVTLQGPTVVVNVDAMHKQDSDPNGWATALVRLPA